MIDKPVPTARTASKVKRLEEYVELLLGELELSDWRLNIHEAMPDEGTEAEVTFCEGQRQAALKFSEAFWTLSPDAQRHLVVHELIHIHTQPVCVAADAVETLIGTAAFAVFTHGITTANEFCTDAIARVLANHLPLPQLEKK